jgi:hypothetical protein
MPHSPILALSALTLALAAPALAACPTTPDDARAGIVIGFDDGATVTLTLLDTGLTREETTFNDGSDEGERTLARHGYLLTELHMTRGGTNLPGESLLRAHPAEVLAAPPLAPGETMQALTDETLDGETLSLTLVLTAGPDEMLRIGDCEVTARRIEVALDPEFGDDRDQYLYLPELQVGFYTGSTGGTLPPLVLRPTSIRMAD